MSIAIFGIGNLLLSDDGVGIHIINRLKEEYDFPDHVEIIDGGTKGLDLLPLLENRDKVLFVDAANFKKEPGTIGTIEGDNIPAFLGQKLSVHHIGIPDMLFAAKLMEITPPEMCLIGIQPESMETSMELTAPVKANFDALLGKVLEKLGEWGVDAAPKKSKKTVQY